MAATSKVTSTDHVAQTTYQARQAAFLDNYYREGTDVLGFWHVVFLRSSAMARTAPSVSKEVFFSNHRPTKQLRTRYCSHATDQRAVYHDTTTDREQRRRTRKLHARITTCDSSSSSSERTCQRTNETIERLSCFSYLPVTLSQVTHVTANPPWPRNKVPIRGTKQQATPWTEFGGSRSYTRGTIDSQAGAAWGASTIRNVETSSWARYVKHPCLSTGFLLPLPPWFLPLSYVTESRTTSNGRDIPRATIQHQKKKKKRKSVTLRGNNFDTLFVSNERVRVCVIPDTFAAKGAIKVHSEKCTYDSTLEKRTTTRSKRS